MNDVLSMYITMATVQDKYNRNKVKYYKQFKALIKVINNGKPNFTLASFFYFL